MHQPEYINQNADAAAVKALAVQKELERTWSESDPSAYIHTIPTIQEAIELAQGISEDLGETQKNFTGSLHLVRGVLSVLEGTSTPPRFRPEL